MATTKPPYDPMKDMVRIQLPRATGREETTLFVGLNGKGYNIKRGVPVNVPRPVYDILMESERMKERQADYDEQLRQQAENRDRLYGLA